jgi:predicted 3-demethylubiquinone-9 3-methyltransferase (glyoxalase superfamily)
VPQSVKTFLMFQGAAHDAARFYASLFRRAELGPTARWAAGEPGPQGAFKSVELTVAGHRLVLFDSPVKHDFTFTPAVSLFVDCDDEKELDDVYAKLLAGGTALMPLGDHGFSRKYGWVNDRFGVSWQLNLP